MNEQEAIVRSYISCINSHDVAGIVALNSRDHVFADSLGTAISKPAQLEQGWQQYFALFPDYRIEITVLATSGDAVLICGTASATHLPTGRHWRIPAAWCAKVANGSITEWHVFADNKPVHDILAGSA